MEQWQSLLTRFLRNECTDRENKIIYHSLRDGLIDNEFRYAIDIFMNDPETQTYIDSMKPVSSDVLKNIRNRLKKQEAKPFPTITHFRKIWYAAAVVLLLGMLIPASYLYLKPKTEQTELVVQYVEVITQRGEIETIFLPDQTKVILNAESRLTYPAVFINERLVQLQGEALFEVTHDNDRPFTVETTEMYIRVLGTVFGVKAYSEDDFSSVSVVSGKVEVETPSTRGAASAASTILLEKNHLLKIEKNTGNFEKLTIDTDKFLSWTDGTLYFHRTPIREVVNMINRYYPQTDIELKEGDYDILISGTHYNTRLEAVLTSIIFSTGLNYKKTGNKITLYQ